MKVEYLPETLDPMARRYDFLHPLSDGLVEEEDALFFEISATRAFRRLQEISFLGAIDYLTRRPNGRKGSRRYTRQQHSLGVARLAVFHCRLQGLDFRARRLACAAGLLHDLGHAPLSHSLEPVFREKFDIDHHKATKLLIKGEELGAEIRQTLQRFSVDCDELISLLEGKHDPFGGLFSGPINFDTIEAILRTLTYNEAASRLPNPEDVVRAATYRAGFTDRDIVDTLWNLKDQVYRYVINSTAGILSDMMSQYFMIESLHKFSKEDYFTTEKDIFKKVPQLRDALSRGEIYIRSSSLFQPMLSYMVRTFEVNSRADFFAREDASRYRQQRVIRHLDLTSISRSTTGGERGMVPDDRLSTYQGILGAEAQGPESWNRPGP